MVKEQLKELEPKVKDVKVTMEDVAKVIELWTGIPAEKVSRNEGEKLQELEDELKAKIIGQDEAIEAGRQGHPPLQSAAQCEKRPASFIFVGPTGVG